MIELRFCSSYSVFNGHFIMSLLYMESRNSEAFCFVYTIRYNSLKSFVSILYTVHSCVVYLRLRYSARSTRTRWTSHQNKRLLTVYSLLTVFNGHFNMLEIIWSLAIARLFVFCASDFGSRNKKYKQFSIVLLW